MNELVSVIVPLYNAEKYIDDGVIKEVCLQTYQNIELILVNDGSTDSTLERIEQFKDIHKENNIRIINQENQGIAFARNNALERIRGNYVLFLDQDDHIPLNYVEKLYSKITEGNYDIVIGGYQTVTEERKIIKKFIFSPEDNWVPFRCIVPWSKIYNKAFIIDNNLKFLNYPIGEDIFFSICAYTKTEKVGIIPCSGYEWVQIANSFSHTVQKKFSETDLRPLFNNICENTFSEDEVIPYRYQYFFLKTIIYQVLHGARGEKYCNAKEFSDKMFSWYEKKCGKPKMLLKHFEPKSEPFVVRLIIRLYVLFKDTFIGRLSLMIYTKI